ncbi:hypothetical protein Syun_006710 [Stephania yunnanensis]|uniref:Uncharacterized protein n=1 Tax=Stephania yunnanensis TaxID=152371 RepID=A0AAP0KYT6_9MAGN
MDRVLLECLNQKLGTSQLTRSSYESKLDHLTKVNYVKQQHVKRRRVLLLRSASSGVHLVDDH